MAIMQYNIISFAAPENGNHVRTYEFSRHTFDWPDVTTRVENIGRNIAFQHNHLSGEFAPGNGLYVPSLQTSFTAAAESLRRETIREML